MRDTNKACNYWGNVKIAYMSLERKFEKELAADIRKETADKLREARKKPETFSDFCKSEITADKYPDKKESLENLKKNIFGRIFKTEKFRQEEALLSEFLKIEKDNDIDKIKRDYKIKFEEILKNSPLTESEKELYLSTESMEKMSLEDFLTLSKRLSGEAFYHVTRYGIRENTFMSTGGGHTISEGKFIDNFTPLLKDGNIKDCTTTVITNRESAESLINLERLKELIAEGKTVAEIVDKALASYGTPYFLDRESSHVSYGKDLHRMYGAENNYKFYFYYPVEYILQNDFYHATREGQITLGRGYYHNKGGINQQYNDFEIFNFGKGLPINAGILCITGDIQVDPKTGSQYLLENGKPIIDEHGEFKKPEETISSQEYWENYFALHPDLKPSKVMYGEFYTSNYEQLPELENWAKSKNIHQQDKDKKSEFLNYQKRVREELRKSLTKVIEEKYAAMKN